MQLLLKKVRCDCICIYYLQLRCSALKNSYKAMKKGLSQLVLTLAYKIKSKLQFKAST